MSTFDSDGVRIRYEEWGQGEPMVLVHGFAASLQANWVAPGWIEVLSPMRRVVALDCRGHGESEKPHDPSKYGTDVMSADVIRLMDHLGIESADLMGYSMGGYISLVTLLRHPQRFRRVVLGGIGSPRSASARGRPNVVKALLAENAASVTDPVGKAFRVFAEASKNDLRALAACMQAGREPTTREQLAGIKNRMLLVVGEKDDVIAEPEELAHAIPGCEFVSIPGRDHLTVVGDRRMKEAVAGFLKA
jgi:pimeloyl-ACP methyl ester carboxylesterase